LCVVRAIITHSGAQLVADALDEDGKLAAHSRAVDVGAQDRAVAHRHGHFAFNLHLEVGNPEYDTGAGVDCASGRGAPWCSKSPVDNSYSGFRW